jgi:hypothetical protein
MGTGRTTATSRITVSTQGFPARNDAGHPNTARPQREQVYVFLQLFIPFARQLMRLRYELA